METEWKPRIFDRSQAGDLEQLAALRDSGRVWQVHDTIRNQVHDLLAIRNPKQKLTPDELAVRANLLLGQTAWENYGRWVFYPWSGRLVHVLPPQEFAEVRQARNRDKITAEEQASLAQLTVGVVGLSVGNVIALTLAMESACGHLKLADFDTLDLSNMNRLRASVHEIGVPKTVLAAREIFEIDPYASVSLYSDGITPENIDAFLLGEPRINIVVEECDTIAMKFLVRERARANRIPVVMETSDRGMLDVERFDLEPDRPLFHGITGAMTSDDVQRLPTRKDRAGVVLDILGVRNMSTRLAASLVEVEETLANWPQLASDVTLGGASTAEAVRRIGLGQPLASGRCFVDLPAALDSISDPAPEPSGAPEVKPATLPAICQPAPDAWAVPDWIRFAAECGAMAPSGGNQQPWRFYSRDDRFWILLDHRRAENLLDIGCKYAYMALGAAVENVVIAAASRGYASHVEPFRSGRDGSVQGAELLFCRGDDAGLARLAAQVDLIHRRVTNRKVAPRVPLQAGDAVSLSAAAALHGSELLLVTGPSQIAELGEIAGEADRIRFTCRETHREVINELRWTAEEAERTRDGLEVATLELSVSEQAALRLLTRSEVAATIRALGAGRALGDLSRNALKAASAAAVITCKEETPAGWIQAGRAMQQVWLAATAAGLAVQPLATAHAMVAALGTPTEGLFNAKERSAILTIQQRLDRLFPPAPGRFPGLLVRLAQAVEPERRALRLRLEEVFQPRRPPQGGV